MLNRSGVLSHWAFPVRVQTNGGFHAVLDMVEDGDDCFTERVGLDPRGALYKVYTAAYTGGVTGTNIWVAEKLTNTAKNKASAEPLRTEKTPMLATIDPRTMPGASPLTRSQRIAPRFWWARTLETEVNTMVAIDVAMAILMASSETTPCLERMAVMNGTMIIPPPIPKRPAKKPVASPIRIRVKIREGSKCMGLERKGVCLATGPAS